MWWLVVFGVIFGADAVYFSMSDINMTIPIDKGKSPPIGRPLATFYASSDSRLNYSIVEGGRYLRISPTKGELSFRDNVDTKNAISAKVAASNSSTSFNLDFLVLDKVDCDLIVEDLCFWKSVQYHIAENAEPALIGSLTSPYLNEICAGSVVNYTLLDKNDEFGIVSSNGLGYLESRTRLDRETKSKHLLEVLCTVENSQHSIRNITRSLVVWVKDVDDNPPEAQEKVFKITVSSQQVYKNQTVDHKDLIFSDRDSQAVNRYKATVLNDTLKILKPQCNKFHDDHLQEVQTAVHCKLKFTKTIPVDRWTYSVVLQLNDTAMNGTNSVVTVPIELFFLNDSGYHPEVARMKTMKPPSLYPSNKVKIFRTAAPLARLLQPLNLNGAHNFILKPLNPKHRNIFNVTYLGGIVFVHHAGNLRNASEYVRLNISWSVNKTRQFDEIEVHVVNEPTKTCTDFVDIQDWYFCSEFASSEKCLSPKSCALATGGAASVAKREGPQRCMWRGEKTPSNESTTLYSTCTPDISTCPDEVCDELEQLHELICPQDCTHNVLIPSEKNKATGRGIYRGSGVCTCTSLSCHCNTIEYTLKNRKSKSTKAPQKTAFANETFFLHSNISRRTSNNSKILGLELARCGTSCVFGIVAGGLFLGGAVALIVICWRLDSVHKAVRNKFSDENQDMSAPLSVYIDRTAPDPLPISFDMTTSLADTAILGIINKYTPDPKWEFPRNQLIIEQTLGEGEFGKVLRAKALNVAGQSGFSTVAVKTLKDDARESELNDLLSEYQLLREVSHPNVIRLLGVCTAPGGPIYLIIEFAEHGSLRNYLRRSRHLKSESGKFPSSTFDDAEDHYDEPNISKVTPKEILSFGWQICKGMVYLSEIKLVHRDLAARNVLLAADKVCKISDFGLTRDIYEDNAYFKRSKGRVPVKWMAPESLSDHVYTNKSDVWSFGILMWELVTLGATPYPGIAVQNLFHLLRQGYRMERPDNCSPTLYNVMRSCWHIDPEQRPSFQELAALWEKMLSDGVDYLDLANNAIHNRSYFCAPFDNDIEVVEDKAETNPLNYLSKSQSYMKCGSADKFQVQPDNNQNDINTQGYETPVKIAKKVQTPTNDNPQYYTDMNSGKN